MSNQTNDETDSVPSRKGDEKEISFDELGIEPAILNAIKEMGFETPTPIQSAALPVLLSSQNDMIGLAQTGTGKTAAFGIPLIQKLKENDPLTRGLILRPTRSAIRLPLIFLKGART